MGETEAQRRRLGRSGELGLAPRPLPEAGTRRERRGTARESAARSSPWATTKRAPGRGHADAPGAGALLGGERRLTRCEGALADRRGDRELDPQLVRAHGATVHERGARCQGAHPVVASRAVRPVRLAPRRASRAVRLVRLALPPLPRAPLRPVRLALRRGARAVAAAAALVLLAAGAATQPLVDLNELALRWTRGQFASPLICELDGHAKRGLRRVLVTAGPRDRPPLSNKLSFVAMNLPAGARCYADTGEDQPDVAGSVMYHLEGISRPDLATREFQETLEREGGFRFDVRTGVLQVGGRKVDFAGGTRALRAGASGQRRVAASPGSRGSQARPRPRSRATGRASPSTSCRRASDSERPSSSAASAGGPPRGGSADALRAPLAASLEAVASGAARNRKRGRRKELYLLAPAPGAEPSHLLKVNHYEAGAGLRRRLFGSKARRELRLAERAAKRGIATPLPLAAGERREGKRVAACYLLVPFVAGARDLRHVLAERLAAGERRALARAFGAFVRRVHDAGIDQDDLQPNNFLLGPRGAEDLYLIDFERLTIRRRIAPRTRAPAPREARPGAAGGEPQRSRPLPARLPRRGPRRPCAGVAPRRAREREARAPRRAPSPARRRGARPALPPLRAGRLARRARRRERRRAPRPEPRARAGRGRSRGSRRARRAHAPRRRRALRPGVPGHLAPRRAPGPRAGRSPRTPAPRAASRGGPPARGAGGSSSSRARCPGASTPRRLSASAGPCCRRSRCSSSPSPGSASSRRRTPASSPSRPRERPSPSSSSRPSGSRLSGRAVAGRNRRATRARRTPARRRRRPAEARFRAAPGEPIRPCVESGSAKPIVSTRSEDPALEERIDRFVVGLGERIDSLQDAESAGDRGALRALAEALRARSRASSATRPSATPPSRLAQAAGDEGLETLRKSVVDLTELSQRVPARPPQRRRLRELEEDPHALGAEHTAARSPRSPSACATISAPIVPAPVEPEVEEHAGQRRDAPLPGHVGEREPEHGHDEAAPGEARRSGACGSSCRRRSRRRGASGSSARRAPP